MERRGGKRYAGIIILQKRGSTYTFLSLHANLSYRSSALGKRLQLVLLGRIVRTLVRAAQSTHDGVFGIHHALPNSAQDPLVLLTGGRSVRCERRVMAGSDGIFEVGLGGLLLVGSDESSGSDYQHEITKNTTYSPALALTHSPTLWVPADLKASPVPWLTSTLFWVGLAASELNASRALDWPGR